MMRALSFVVPAKAETQWRGGACVASAETTLGPRLRGDDGGFAAARMRPDDGELTDAS